MSHRSITVCGVEIPATPMGEEASDFVKAIKLGPEYLEYVYWSAVFGKYVVELRTNIGIGRVEGVKLPYVGFVVSCEMVPSLLKHSDEYTWVTSPISALKKTFGGGLARFSSIDEGEIYLTAELKRLLVIERSAEYNRKRAMYWLETSGESL